MDRKTKFPKGFLWGTATSAHQVEGSNIHNDWWKWEQKSPNLEKSGIAVDHYNRYEEDFKLAKNVLNNNSHRLSVEWARVEPKDGKFDLKEIQHYKKVLTSLKKLDLKVVLTLHHFTNPTWFADKGGWEKSRNNRYFERYASLCIKEFGSLVDYWIIFNEANVYTYKSYMEGTWPPQKRNLLLLLKTNRNFINTHKRVYREIHRKFPKAIVSSCQNMSLYRTTNPLLRAFIPIIEFLNNYIFFYMTRGFYDFIGVNYYSKFYMDKTPPGVELTDFGWPIYPKGIYEICNKVWKKFKSPIFITENGIADANDDQRPKFIKEHLKWLLKSINAGADIRGYFHWTLMDNFEWDSGRRMKFGLFKTDFKTLKRIPRKSAYVYSKICKENGF